MQMVAPSADIHTGPWLVTYTTGVFWQGPCMHVPNIYKTMSPPNPMLTHATHF